eukprot:CAMPEP_0173184864 /NCGR_PEP_ID=MMETSP1141-20130122/9217_1 /TAXON_ID=483371 /ORGANISM="non described non described, Strain CCMP2298" /LENGTH=379 /DNA_ID=CAMNT_0014108291 /DNA_START=177 /DNA_END=1313 /DNA_ORIENTATION=-
MSETRNSEVPISGAVGRNEEEPPSQRKPKHKGKRPPTKSTEHDRADLADRALIKLRVAPDNLKDLPKYQAGMGLKTLTIRATREKARNKICDLSLSPECYLRLHLTPLSTHTVRLNASSLLELDVSHNKLEAFPSADVLGALPHLLKLLLNDNLINGIHTDALEALSHGHLLELNLASNSLTLLPPSIGQLTTLRCLNLSKNRLLELPKEIVHLPLYDAGAFLISGNCLINPQQATAQRGGLGWIRTYFTMLCKDKPPNPTDAYFHNMFEQQSLLKEVRSKGVRSLQLKLLVVGHQGAGKTSLIAKLKEALEYKNWGDGVGAGSSSSNNNSNNNHNNNNINSSNSSNSINSNSSNNLNNRAGGEGEGNWDFRDKPPITP